MTDPTNVIDSFDRAEVLALGMLRLAPDPAPEFWQDTSAPVLATLLYAASPVMLDAGLGWVQETVQAMAAGEMFAPPEGTPEVYARSVVRTQLLHPRQKDSVLRTLQGAIDPWVSAGVRGRCA